MEYITLKCGKYEAHILPELGGNIIYFYDKEQAREILRGTHDEQKLKEETTQYGMPFLLPPNRIEGGKFEFEGRKYQFPVNEPANNANLHGFFKTVDYTVEKEEHSSEKEEVVLKYEFDEKNPDFQYFPHKIQIQKKYSLTAKGLETELKITNNSSEKIPMMFAYHTAFPLMKNEEKNKEMNIKMSVNSRVKLTSNLMGTEEKVVGDHIASVAAEKGFSPILEELDNVYQMKNFGFRGAIIEYPEYQAQTVYEVDDIFHYFVVWNCKQRGDIICLEPQTYKNNGINLPSWQKDGICLEAGEEIKAITKLSSEKMV